MSPPRYESEGTWFGEERKRRDAERARKLAEVARLIDAAPVLMYPTPAYYGGTDYIAHVIAVAMHAEMPLGISAEIETIRTSSVPPGTIRIRIEVCK